MSCIVVECRSHSSRKENDAEIISFHRFPTDVKMTQKRLAAIARASYDDRLPPDVIPEFPTCDEHTSEMDMLLLDAVETVEQTMSESQACAYLLISVTSSYRVIVQIALSTQILRQAVKLTSMTNSAAKASEIFREAGIAFNKLSEMTILLHPVGDSQHGGKWTDEEIEMLRSCVHRFSIDLNRLSQHIKNKTVTKIRSTMKQKLFDDAGIPVRQINSTGTRLSHMQTPQVTLNMLNASENETDVEELSNDVKLEFETSNEEMTS